MTLIPVSNISSCVDCSSKSGAGRFVHRLANHVDHAAQRFLAHGHADRPAHVDGLHAAHHAVRRLHGHRAHAALAQVLLDFEDYIDGRGHLEALVGDAQRLINRRHRRLFKLHVHGRAGDLNHFADVFCHFFCLFKSQTFASPVSDAKLC
jgi:hypothetical protein